MNRRNWFKALITLNFLPGCAKMPGKLKIRATTHFLISHEEGDKIIYDLNVFQTEWKLIAEYIEENPLRTANSKRVRFESKQIYVGEPSALDRSIFEKLCYKNLRREDLTFIDRVSKIILV